MPSAAAVCGHLQPVHVGAGEEAHVEPVEPLEPGDRVGGDVLVGMPDVRGAVGVGDRCGDVVGLAHLGSPYCVAVSVTVRSRRAAAAARAAGAAGRRAHPPRRVRCRRTPTTCARSSTAPRRVGVQAVVTIADDLDVGALGRPRPPTGTRACTPPSRCTRRAPTRSTDDAKTVHRAAGRPSRAWSRSARPAWTCTGRAGSTAAPSPREQREAFAWHIDLAKRTGKPLMIHNRDADADVLDVLRAEGAPADGDLPLLLVGRRRWRARASTPAGC